MVPVAACAQDNPGCARAEFRLEPARGKHSEGGMAAIGAGASGLPAGPVQALSLKCAADRDTLAAELAQAKQNMAAGRPPTAGADTVRWRC